MATGLNFQTQTIINSNLDPDSSKLNGKGTDNTYLFKSDKTNIDGVEVDALKIKRDFVFVKDCVKIELSSATKKSATKAKFAPPPAACPCTAEITIFCIFLICKITRLTQIRSLSKSSQF